MSTSGRFLSRWSRLKLAPVEAEAEKPVTASALPLDAVAAEGASPAAVDQVAPPAALPDIASLALDSDFTAFLKDEVSEGLRRQALKKLFNAPHFNVMDGLDIYIDDYSVSTPIPPELMAKMRSAAEWLADRDVKEEAAPTTEQTPQEVALASDGSSLAEGEALPADAERPVEPVPSESGAVAEGDDASPAVSVDAAPTAPVAQPVSPGR